MGRSFRQGLRWGGVMPIAVTCTCGKKFTTKDENAGKKSRCAACGATIVIPRAATVAVGAKAPSASSATSAPRKASAAPREDTFDLVGTEEYAPPKKQGPAAAATAAPAPAAVASPRVPPAAMR